MDGEPLAQEIWRGDFWGRRTEIRQLVQRVNDPPPSHPYPAVPLTRPFLGASWAPVRACQPPRVHGAFNPRYSLGQGVHVAAHLGHVAAYGRPPPRPARGHATSGSAAPARRAGQRQRLRWRPPPRSLVGSACVTAGRRAAGARHRRSGSPAPRPPMRVGVRSNDR